MLYSKQIIGGFVTHLVYLCLYCEGLIRGRPLDNIIPALVSGCVIEDSVFCFIITTWCWKQGLDLILVMDVGCTVTVHYSALGRLPCSTEFWMGYFWMFVPSMRLCVWISNKFSSAAKQARFSQLNKHDGERTDQLQLKPAWCSINQCSVLKIYLHTLVAEFSVLQ